MGANCPSVGPLKILLSEGYLLRFGTALQYGGHDCPPKCPFSRWLFSYHKSVLRAVSWLPSIVDYWWMCLFMQMVVKQGLEVMENVLGWDSEKTAVLVQACEAELSKRLRQVQALQSLHSQSSSTNTISQPQNETETRAKRSKRTVWNNMQDRYSGLYIDGFYI